VVGSSFWACRIRLAIDPISMAPEELVVNPRNVLRIRFTPCETCGYQREVIKFTVIVPFQKFQELA
jgi:hypothetical protein